MAFEAGFKSYVWSDEPAETQADWRRQGVSVGVAAAMGLVTAGALVRPRANGTRALDDVAHVARLAGNLSPFQIANTFAVPEWLSPFTSPAYQKLTEVKGRHQLSIDQKYLKGESTYSYLKSLTGMSDAQLSTAGITPHMAGPASSTASHLLFEKHGAGDINGRLYSVVNKKRHLLHANTMLMQFSGETALATDLATKNQPVNRVAKSVFAAMNLWKEDNFKASGVFTEVVKGAGEPAFNRPRFIPVPGIGLNRQGTTYMRAMPSFSMERFNRLISNFGNEVLGERFGNTMQRLLGTSPGVLPGPAAHMYSRFGLKAAGVLGVGLSIAELDWLRRQGGIAGHTAVSALMGAGAGLLATRAGAKPKTGLFVGLGAFMGQMVLPGFERGLMPGAATTYALATSARSVPVNPFNYYRRSLEGFFPGISGTTTGILAGAALVGAANLRIPGTGRPLPNYLLDQYGPSVFGLANRTAKGMDVRGPKAVRDHFWDLVLQFAEKKSGGVAIDAISAARKANKGWTTSTMRAGMMTSLRDSGLSVAEISEHLNGLHSVAEQRFKLMAPVNPVNTALVERLTDVAAKYNNKSGFVNKALMQLEGLGEQLRHGFFGASLSEPALRKSMGKLGFLPTMGSMGLLFAAGFLGHQVLSGALFGSMEDYGDLQNIYSGRQLVNAEKSRWWELGGTPWGGNDKGDLRPHWYPVMMNRVNEAATWGMDEDRFSPLAKFFLSNFTHYLEKKNYYDRPYPISSPAFSNIPIIGPALGATIGQVFKPSRIMHAGEWIQSTDGNLQFADVFDGWKREPAYNLGAADPGIPRSPYSPKAVFSDLNYNFRDLSGLTGWMADNVSNFLVGTDIYFGDQPRLAESGAMTSYRKAFWDMGLGGGGPLGEIVRRVLPSMPKDIERRNPIINSMPCVPAETEILGADGLLYRADTIGVGFEVVDHFGDTQVVDAITNYPVDEIVELDITGSNVFPMRYSLSHPIWVYGKGFVKAEDLQKGDYLGFPVRSYANRPSPIIDLCELITTERYDSDYIYYGRRNITDECYRIAESFNFDIRAIPLAVKRRYRKLYSICNYYSGKTTADKICRVRRYWSQDDLFFLLGVWAAKGSASNASHTNWCLAGCQQDKWLDRIVSILSKYECTFSIQPAKGKGIKLCSSSTPIGQLLMQQIPGDCYHKYLVPELIAHTQPADAIIALLSGLAQGDGYFFTTSRIRFGIRTTSRLLVYQLRNLFIDLFKQVPGISLDNTTSTPSYHVTISGQSAYDIGNALGYSCGSAPTHISPHRYFYDGTHIYVALKNVQRIITDTIVYGHSISNTHTFCTSLLSTHNTWIPLNLHYGDPYASMPYGEASLPGSGYAKLHPELQNTDPENYPLVYRYDILSQVSPLSKEFRSTRDAIYRQRMSGALGPDVEAWIDRIDKQVQMKWNVLDFNRVHENAIELPGSGVTQQIWFDAQEQFRKQVAPLEYLVPGGVRPIQKLLGSRDPVERYEYERMYGSGGMAFWDKPFRDFIRPSMYSLAHLMGYEGKPLWRMSADATNQQFDQLEFYKWMTLANQARAQGNTQAKIQYEYQAANTRMGVNPQGNPLSIYWTLPAEDRAYFNAFAFAEGKDRDRILQMVPSDQVSLYQTLWSRIDTEDPRLWSGGSSSPDENYLYQQFYNLDQSSMPPVDWIGMNQDVDLRDIKVRYVNEIGRDLHDYGLWENEVRKAYSQPFLEGSTQYIHQPNIYRGAIAHNVREGFGGGNVSVFSSNASVGNVNLQYDDNRADEIQVRLASYRNKGY